MLSDNMTVRPPAAAPEEVERIKRQMEEGLNNGIDTGVGIAQAVTPALVELGVTALKTVPYLAPYGSLMDLAKPAAVISAQACSQQSGEASKRSVPSIANGCGRVIFTSS